MITISGKFGNVEYLVKFPTSTETLGSNEYTVNIMVRFTRPPTGKQDTRFFEPEQVIEFKVCQKDLRDFITSLELLL